MRLELVSAYQACGSLRETAKRLGTSRNTVRKWVRRYQAHGEKSLRDRSRRPRCSPRWTPSEVEEQVLALHAKHGWGRRRIAHALGLPEGTVRHILRRYPARAGQPAQNASISIPPAGPGRKRSRSAWPRWTPKTSWTRAPLFTPRPPGSFVPECFEKYGKGHWICQSVHGGASDRRGVIGGPGRADQGVFPAQPSSTYQDRDRGGRERGKTTFRAGRWPGAPPVSSNGWD